MTLVLQPVHLEILKTQARQAYPEECCGLLLGTRDDAQDVRWIQEILPQANAWTEDVLPITEAGPPSLNLIRTKCNRYWIDPKALMEAQRYGRDRGWLVLGVYHSHPDHAAVPSERDRTLAWTEYSYPILAVHQGQVIDLRSWRLGEDQQFWVEAIEILDSSGGKPVFQIHQS